MDFVNGKPDGNRNKEGILGSTRQFNNLKNQGAEKKVQSFPVKFYCS
jgi:hypothetical protein